MTTQPPEPPPEGSADPGTQPPPPPPAASPYGQETPSAPSYSAAPPPASSAVPGGPVPGSLLDRFLARLIDGVLLAIVNAIIVGAIIIGVVMGESGGYGFGTGTSFAVSAVSAVLGAAIYLGYFAFFESSRGQTVGKMIMKLRTVGPDGGNPTMEQAIRRNLWSALGILGVVPVIGGLVGALAQLVAVIMIAVGINKDTVNRQGWHDHFAGETRVLKIG